MSKNKWKLTPIFVAFSDTNLNFTYGSVVRIDAIRIFFSLVFFFIPWHIVRVNLTGLWLRSKQDFILLSALFLRCGQP